jgi:hypothetical protein
MMSNLAEAIASPAGVLAVLAALLSLTPGRSLTWPALAGGRFGGAALHAAIVAVSVYASAVLFTAVTRM